MEFHALLALRVTSTLAKLRDRCPRPGLLPGLLGCIAHYSGLV